MGAKLDCVGENCVNPALLNRNDSDGRGGKAIGKGTGK